MADATRDQVCALRAALAPLSRVMAASRGTVALSASRKEPQARRCRRFFCPATTTRSGCSVWVAGVAAGRARLVAPN